MMTPFQAGAFSVKRVKALADQSGQWYHSGIYGRD